MFSIVYLNLIIYWKIITSLIIAVLVYKLYNFYSKLSSLPPGPTPLPVIGNILMMTTEKHWVYTVEEMIKKYGSVFTIWMGNKPTILIADPDLAKQTFDQVNFSGKHPSYVGTVLSMGRKFGLVFIDSGPECETLRKITHQAIEFMTASNHHGDLVMQAMDQTIDTIIEREGIDKAFNPAKYISYLFNTLGMMALFGEGYKIDDQDYIKLKYLTNDFKNDVGKRTAAWEFSKLIRILDYKLVNLFEHNINLSLNVLMNKIQNHFQTFDETNIRDGCDAFFGAYKDALQNDLKSAKSLSFENLAATIITLFLGNAENPHILFLWCLLYLVHYPGVQKKLRQEIQTQIGDRIPTKDDKNRCHYVMAFITESLRISCAAASSLPHKVLSKSKIGEYEIPKDANVVLCIAAMGRDERYWTNPTQFNPDRFIIDNKYSTAVSEGFIPFSVGQRNCLGGKLTFIKEFLILVRFLQKTADYNLELASHNGLEANPVINATIEPKKYEIIFKEKK